MHAKPCVESTLLLYSGEQRTVLPYKSTTNTLINLSQVFFD